MTEHSSNVRLEQKMAAMRLKNLELLKRHQEIEEDRQLAQREGAEKNIEIMRGGAVQNRVRLFTKQANGQEIQTERVYRPPIRRKFESDRNEVQSQRAQRVDYTRLKHDRAREITHPKSGNNSHNPELHEYAFHQQSNVQSDLDGPSHAKKLVIVNNNANRIGSGRFNQQQQGQRKREERMRRSLGQNNGHTGVTNEFHLDIPSMPVWSSSPMHVQLIPTNLNGHPSGIDHLINTSADSIDQSAYLHNFVYSPAAVPFNGNGPVYFAHPPPSSQPSFHPYHPTTPTRPQFPLPIFSSPLPQQTLSTGTENSSNDLSSRFRHLKAAEHENKTRPMLNNDFERLHTNPYASTTRFNHEQHHRFQFRPQTSYDFSSSNTLNNNNFSRSSNNYRYQKNNNNASLPLSAYMNTDNTDENRMNNHHRTNTIIHARRRMTTQQQQPQQQRPYHQDKHQFPLSSYDPRQYGFNENSTKRNHLNNRSTMNKIDQGNNELQGNSNDIDLIEEWWEDDNADLIGTEAKVTTTVNDSGNSSLSNSINLKETISDISTTDSNIIESLDKLQQQLKLEEAVDERIASSEANKELTTYDTAHFMQWAKEKFREELAGRLTAQEIEQHDAVTTDDDDHEGKMDALHVDLHEKLTIDENQFS